MPRWRMFPRDAEARRSLRPCSDIEAAALHQARSWKRGRNPAARMKGSMSRRSNRPSSCRSTCTISLPSGTRASRIAQIGWGFSGMAGLPEQRGMAPELTKWRTKLHPGTCRTQGQDTREAVFWRTIGTTVLALPSVPHCCLQCLARRRRKRSLAVADRLRSVRGSARHLLVQRSARYLRAPTCPWVAQVPPMLFPLKDSTTASAAQ